MAEASSNFCSHHFSLSPLARVFSTFLPSLRNALVDPRTWGNLPLHPLLPESISSKHLGSELEPPLQRESISYLSPDPNLWRFLLILESKLGSLEAFSKPSESFDEAGLIPLGAVGSLSRFLLPPAANMLLSPPFRDLVDLLAGVWPLTRPFWLLPRLGWDGAEIPWLRTA